MCSGCCAPALVPADVCFPRRLLPIQLTQELGLAFCCRVDVVYSVCSVCSVCTLVCILSVDNISEEYISEDLYSVYSVYFRFVIRIVYKPYCILHYRSSSLHTAPFVLYSAYALACLYCTMPCHAMPTHAHPCPPMPDCQKDRLTTRPASSPVYTTCGSGRIQLIPDEIFDPLSRLMSVWCSCRINSSSNRPSLFVLLHIWSS